MSVCHWRGPPQRTKGGSDGRQEKQGLEAAVWTSMNSSERTDWSVFEKGSGSGG